MAKQGIRRGDSPGFIAPVNRASAGRGHSIYGVLAGRDCWIPFVYSLSRRNGHTVNVNDRRMIYLTDAGAKSIPQVRCNIALPG